MIIIDPYRLSEFPRTQDGFQQLVLYSICAAGHGAWVMARNLELFMSLADGVTPFDKVTRLAKTGQLASFMRECGFGTPNQFAVGYEAAAKLNLPEQITVAELGKIPRIGPKTARLIVHNAFPAWDDRAEEDRRELAILDRLILRWMRNKGYRRAPQDTPQDGKAYDRWEKVWEKLKAKHGGNDLDLWNDMTRQPPADWKTRPIKRNVGGTGRWFVQDGVEVERRVENRRIKFYVGSKELVTV